MDTPLVPFQNKKTHLHTFITKWIDKVSLIQKDLNGHAVCPFAKTAQFEIKELDDPLNFIPDSFQDIELRFYVLPSKFTIKQVEEFSVKNNKLYPNLIFIPDPKNKSTFIKNVQTNNGKYNLVFCQPREKMIKARRYLKKIGYYSNWTEEQLKNIFQQDYEAFFEIKCPFTRLKFKVQLALNKIYTITRAVKHIVPKSLKLH